MLEYARDHPAILTGADDRRHLMRLLFFLHVAAIYDERKRKTIVPDTKNDRPDRFQDLGMIFPPTPLRQGHCLNQSIHHRSRQPLMPLQWMRSDQTRRRRTLDF